MMELICRGCHREFKTNVVKPDMLCSTCAHNKAKAEAKIRVMIFRDSG